MSLCSYWRDVFNISMACFSTVTVEMCSLLFMYCLQVLLWWSVLDLMYQIRRCLDQISSLSWYPWRHTKLPLFTGTFTQSSYDIMSLEWLILQLVLMITLHPLKLISVIYMFRSAVEVPPLHCYLTKSHVNFDTHPISICSECYCQAQNPCYTNWRSILCIRAFYSELYSK